MAKKMLIDATHPEETRVVVVDGNKVEDFDFESINKRQLAGNIYLAKVTRVEPSLQAAFVEYGGNRHGFLAFSEIHPDYYQIPIADREALLAEEEREEAEQRRREEDSEAEEKPRRRRRKSRSEQSDSNDQRENESAAAAAAVAGLEVIDIDTGDGASAAAFSDDEVVPRGLEMADVVPDEADGSEVEAEAVSEEDAEGDDVKIDTSTDTGTGDDDALVEDTPAAAQHDGPTNDQAEATATDDEPHSPAPESLATDTTEGAVDAEPSSDQADEAATSSAPDVATEASTASDQDDSNAEKTPEGDVSDGTPPRSIAEAAGLDDNDRISEDVDSARNANSVAAEESSDAATEAAGAGSQPAEETTSDSTADAEPSAVGEESAGSAEDAPAPDSTVSDETNQTAGEDDAGTANDAPVSDADDHSSGTEATSQETATAPDTDEHDSAAATAESADPESSQLAEGAEPDATENEAADNAGDGAETEEQAPRKSRRRRRSRNDRKQAADDSDGDANDDDNDEVEQVGADDVHEEVASTRVRARRKYKIQDVIKVRQILLVQVVKEERGNKGAALTTYLSLAGRYCVLMPNTARGGGISRKIVNAADRKRLREITAELEVPKGMGLIVRTAGAERTRAEIKRDYEFLTRQWEQIRDLTLKSVAPALIYEEGSLIKRSIRDIYSKEIDQIQVEGEHGYREAKEYMKMLMPSHAKNVQPYADPIPLFSRYQVESYLNGMFNPTVQLKSGGYIVIGVTEALVAIDVNSGRATKQGSIEDTALQTNLEACDEVARQLRLRDLAGLIVIDFIDMDENRNNRAVEKRMKDRLKTDRARIQVGRISAFGLMEMSRQRLRPGMLEATTQPCPHCMGTGLIRSEENLTLSILREIEEEGVRSRANQITIKVPVAIANYLINQKRETLAQIEERHGVSVAILADPLLNSPNYEIERSKSQTTRPVRQSDVVTSSSVVSDEDLVDETEGAETGRDEDGKNRRRRGKRGGRRRRGDEQSDDSIQEADSQTSDSEDAAEDDNGEDGDRRRRSRRGGRRRRGGRNRRGSEDASANESGEPNGMEVVDPEGVEAGEQATVPRTDAPEATETVAEGQEPLDVSSAELDAADLSTDADAADIETEQSEVTAEEPAAPEEAASPEFAEEAEPEAPEAETVDESGDEPDSAPEAEPDAEPVLEPVAAEPEEPAKPKRRGWWSLGR
ncbi:MAG: Rne/Rng family ribonuclease [Pseudomonadota bacterium]